MFKNVDSQINKLLNLQIYYCQNDLYLSSDLSQDINMTPIN